MLNPPLLSIAEGWTDELPPFTLSIDGTPLNHSGITLTFIVRDPSGALVTLGGTTRKDAVSATGKVYYKPAAADFTRLANHKPGPQLFAVRWKAEDGSGNVVYFPNGAAAAIAVHRA